MDTILIRGGNRLEGEVTISGAKNASLPLMAAALLGTGPTTLQNVPRLQDIQTMRLVLEHLGAEVADEGEGIRIDPAGFQGLEAPYNLVRKMRASIYVLGPLLARFGQAKVSLPGGCAIGNRPIDLHLKGFEALGAEIDVKHGYVVAKAPRGGLQGADCVLSGAAGSSVGATCNVLMAAVLAKGRSVLRGAACEPEVDDLVHFLNEMGAKISGTGTGVLEVEGVEALQGASHRVIPDRIEAGTFLVAAALAEGPIRALRCCPEHLETPLEKLAEMGCQVEVGEDWVECRGPSTIRPIAARTLPYPGFPTDMQAQFLVAMALADGESSITETIYPDRFIHVAELNRMGAEISVAHATAVARGVQELTGAAVMASDLRASAALVLAGLAARGETEILRVYHLDRGYDQMESKFCQLGGDVERVSYKKSPA